MLAVNENNFPIFVAWAWIVSGNVACPLWAVFVRRSRNSCCIHCNTLALWSGYCQYAAAAASDSKVPPVSAVHNRICDNARWPASWSMWLGKSCTAGCRTCRREFLLMKRLMLVSHANEVLHRHVTQLVLRWAGRILIPWPFLMPSLHSCTRPPMPSNKWPNCTCMFASISWLLLLHSTPPLPPLCFSIQIFHKFWWYCYCVRWHCNLVFKKASRSPIEHIKREATIRYRYYCASAGCLQH